MYIVLVKIEYKNRNIHVLQIRTDDGTGLNMTERDIGGKEQAGVRKSGNYFTE